MLRTAITFPIDRTVVQITIGRSDRDIVGFSAFQMEF